MIYRPEIDGLRALAVLPVILFHAGFQFFSGGFVGVDIFFVISGYLITSIILSDMDNGNFSLLNFYERRARRILPALFFVILACIPLAWFLLLPKDLIVFSQGLIAVPLFSSNILFWQTADYFATASELNPLLHTWSLAVEEQYYLLFPIFMLLTYRLDLKITLGILILVSSLSLAFAQWGSINAVYFSFFMLPARGWEILIGAFAAFYLNKRITKIPSKWNQLFSFLGMLLIIFSIVYFDKQTPFPSLYTLFPTIGTVLIILFADKKTFIGHLLSGNIFVRIGLISYSAYLWHQPLLAFARHRIDSDLSNSILITLVILTFVLAHLSWRYIEAPFRNKKRFEQKKVFILAGLSSLLIIFLGIYGTSNQGHVNRIPMQAKISEFEMPSIANGWCFYSIDTIDSLEFGNQNLKCWLGKSPGKKVGLLFGDSFAGQYEPFWDKVGARADLRIHSVTTNWCFPSLNSAFGGRISSPAFDQCLLNREYVKEHLLDYDFLILAGGWGDLLAHEKFDNAIEFIKYASKKTRVIIMASPKQFDKNIMDAFKKSIWWHTDFDIEMISFDQDNIAQDANKTLYNLAKNNKNIMYIDRNSLFAVNNKLSDITLQNLPFHFDADHISIHGSHSAADIFMNSSKYSAFKDFLLIESPE